MDINLVHDDNEGEDKCYIYPRIYSYIEDALVDNEVLQGYIPSYLWIK